VDLRQVAEAAQILTERREKDGLYALVSGDPGPFSHQAKLWESTKSEAWIFGANRSGKTEGLMARRAARLRFGASDPRGAYGNGVVIFDRAIKCWVVSLNREMSRDIVQPKLFNNGAAVGGKPFMIPASEIASWNITNQTLRMKNGSLAIFKSGDQGAEAFQGADVDDIDYDEVPDEDVYRESTLRVGGGRRLLIRGAATILPPPGQPGGIRWMFSKKIRPWLDAGRKDPDLDIFTASIYDNPTILPEEIRRLESIFKPGTPEYLIRMKGHLLPTIGGSLTYPGFLRQFHMNPALAPLDPDGARRPSVHPYLPLVLAVDFNATNGVWLVGQKLNGRFRVVDEIALERSDVASMAAEFRSRFPAHGAELWVYGDSTGRRRDAQTGESSFYMLQEYLQGYPTPIRFILPDVNPPVRDRVNAVNRVLQPGDGSRMAEFAEHCERLAHDFETTKWKANGTIDKSNQAEQSNGADAFGYWVVGDSPVPRYAGSSARLTSIRGPRYTAGGSGRVFPGGVTVTGRRFGAPRHA
jgi:hypothetical protein